MCAFDIWIHPVVCQQHANQIPLAIETRPIQCSVAAEILGVDIHGFVLQQLPNDMYV